MKDSRKAYWSAYKRECWYEYAKRKVRILPAENLRFPGEGSSAQGKSGPKLRPKGVSDGQLVEIPIPPQIVLIDGVTQEDDPSVPLVEYVQATSGYYRQIRSAITTSSDGERK